MIYSCIYLSINPTIHPFIHSSTDSSTHLFNGDHRLVEALYDYNPSEQSPNENPEEELSFQEGDYISVNGEPDNDGFYQVCNYYNYLHVSLAFVLFSLLAKFISCYI